MDMSFVLSLKLPQFWPLGSLCGLASVSFEQALAPACASPFSSETLFYFLALRDVLGWSCILPAQPCNQPFLLEAPIFFHWRMILRTQIWVLQILTAARVLLVQRPPQQTELGNVSMCTNLAHTLLSLFIYTNVSSHSFFRTNPVFHGILWLFLYLIVIYYSTSEKYSFHYLQLIYLFFQPWNICKVVWELLIHAPGTLSFYVKFAFFLT